MSEILLPVEDGLWSREAIEEEKRRQFERARGAIDDLRRRYADQKYVFDKDREYMKARRAEYEAGSFWKRLLRWLLCPASIPRRVR